MLSVFDIIGYVCIVVGVIISFGAASIIIAAIMSGSSNESSRDDDWGL